MWHVACAYKLPLAARLSLELGVDLHAKYTSGKSSLYYTLSSDTFICHAINGDGDIVLCSIPPWSSCCTTLSSITKNQE